MLFVPRSWVTGDEVWSRPENAAHDEPPLVRNVCVTYVTNPDALVHLTYRTDSGVEETLDCTVNHPFYSVDREDFIHAADLQQGELLALTDSYVATVSQVTIDQAR